MQEYFYNLITDRQKGFFPVIVKAFLYILSLLYGLVVRILAFFYRLAPVRINCKVISVGNITLGGTGKTVLVDYIATYLKQNRHKPAVLSRGYKGADEPNMLREKLKDIPVVVNPDRIKAAKKAIKDYNVDTVILDDAFQQWRIDKDLEIVTIDAVNPFGNRQVIPRGILREPLSALGRADVFILTKTGLISNVDMLKKYLQFLNPSAMIIESVHKPLGFYPLIKPQEFYPARYLEGNSVAAFCGIADPDSFQRSLEDLGVKPVLFFKFADHHQYTPDELDNIVKQAQEKNIGMIVTTEKDAARIYDLRITNYDLRILVLRITLNITKGEDEFHHRLLKLYPL